MRVAIKEVKQKTCKACGTKFKPHLSTQKACSVRCALDMAPANLDRARKAIEQRERAQLKARKEKLKSRSDYIQEAEKAVRDYRRTYELSIGSGCISCGESQEAILAEQGWKTGGAFDAGHFLSKGARPELRMEPKNIWLQCKGCNAGSFKFARKGATVSEGFRAGLIERIGLEEVEALEADHTPRKYTIEELQAIKSEYREKLKTLNRTSVSH